MDEDFEINRLHGISESPWLEPIKKCTINIKHEPCKACMTMNVWELYPKFGGVFPDARHKD